jgi:hypothetical protein
VDFIYVSTDFHAGYDGGEVNYLDPKTVEHFLSIAEKPYLDKFKNQAGKTMAGVYPTTKETSAGEWPGQNICLSDS